MRQAAAMMGAIGNLEGLYGYTTPIWGNAFGEYAAGANWIATDPTNGFRIMNYQQRAFQVDPQGVATFGFAEQAEIVTDPTSAEIRFVLNGVTQSAISADTRTIYGIERLGRPLGPNIEWGAIPDASGAESLERFGFWMRNLGGDRFFAILSGTEAQPDSASLRIGTQGSAEYLDFSDGALDIAARLHILGNSEIVGNLAITNGTLTWANSKHTADATGLHLAVPGIAGENITLFDTPATLYANRLLSRVSVAQEMMAGSTLLFETRGYDDAIVGGASKIDLTAYGSYTTDATSVTLQLTAPETGSGTSLYCDAEQATFSGRVLVANATAATDALNRQTGDGRYMALANEANYLLAAGIRAGATSQAQTFTNGIVGPSWKPAADSTTALQMQNAAGYGLLVLDTTNSFLRINARVGINIAPNASYRTYVYDLMQPAANGQYISNRYDSLANPTAGTGYFYGFSA